MRAEATQLALEIYKWYGQTAADVICKDLKPVQVRGVLRSSLTIVRALQVKELTDLFQTSTERPTPERLLRSQQSTMELDQPEEVDGSVDAAAAAAVAAESETPVIDAFDINDPVDVLSKVSDKIYTEIASANWKERKEGLETILNLVNKPRLAEGTYHQLIGALAKVGPRNIHEFMLAACTGRQSCLQHFGCAKCGKACQGIATWVCPTSLPNRSQHVGEV